MEIYVKTKGNAKLRSWVKKNFKASEMGENFLVIEMDTLKELNKFMFDAAHATKMQMASPVLCPIDDSGFELKF